MKGVVLFVLRMFVFFIRRNTAVEKTFDFATKTSQIYVRTFIHEYSKFSRIANLSTAVF